MPLPLEVTSGRKGRDRRGKSQGSRERKVKEREGHVCRHGGESTVCVHEKSHYIVHYNRRKEEGKEGRKKRTIYNSLVYMYMYMHVAIGVHAYVHREERKIHGSYMHCTHVDMYMYMYVCTCDTCDTCVHERSVIETRQSKATTPEDNSLFLKRKRRAASGLEPATFCIPGRRCTN